MFVLVALWAFFEAVVFVIVADVPISFIAVRYGVRPAVKAALVSCFCAALGGMCLYWIALHWPESVEAVFMQLPAIDQKLSDAAQADFQQRGFFAMLSGAFAGVPYKLYALAAAKTGVLSWPAFFLLSLAARLPRFLLMATLPGWIARRMDRKTALIVLSSAWLIFYAVYFRVMPI